MMCAAGGLIYMVGLLLGVDGVWGGWIKGLTDD
jgi:hypothetical protein